MFYRVSSFIILRNLSRSSPKLSSPHLSLGRKRRQSSVAGVIALCQQLPLLGKVVNCLSSEGCLSSNPMAIWVPHHARYVSTIYDRTKCRIIGYPETPEPWWFWWEQQHRPLHHCHQPFSNENLKYSLVKMEALFSSVALIQRSYLQQPPASHGVDGFPRFREFSDQYAYSGMVHCILGIANGSSNRLRDFRRRDRTNRAKESDNIGHYITTQLFCPWMNVWLIPFEGLTMTEGSAMQRDIVSFPSCTSLIFSNSGDNLWKF